LENLAQIGLGGGCHWCTEAVFSVLKGVSKVEQGWIASTEKNKYFSEAVLIEFDSTIIDLETLVSIHLYTHSSTSYHSMRNKYRSAVYFFSFQQQKEIIEIMEGLRELFTQRIITQILPFSEFKLNQEKYLNYYKKNKDNGFCKRYINPKLEMLLARYKPNLKENLVDSLEIK
jgi:peptide-methionine (S)-S-oxide reductase